MTDTAVKEVCDLLRLYLTARHRLEEAWEKSRSLDVDLETWMSEVTLYQDLVGRHRAELAHWLERQGG